MHDAVIVHAALPAACVLYILWIYCPSTSEYEGSIRAGIARMQASTMCSKHVMHASKTTHPVWTQTDGCTPYALPFHKHRRGFIPRHLCLDSNMKRFVVIFLLIFLVRYECVVGWQYVETCFVSLYLLYSFWMSTLVSMTAARDETCRSKKRIPAESCNL